MKKIIKNKDICIEHGEFEWIYTKLDNGEFYPLKKQFINCIDFKELPTSYVVNTKCPICGKINRKTYLKEM